MSMSDAVAEAPQGGLSGKWYSGLTYRYVFQLAAVSVFLSVLLILNAAYEQRRSVLEEMRQRGELLGESLAGACSQYYLFEDMEAVRFVFGKAKNIRDVVSIVPLDLGGKVDPSFEDEAQNPPSNLFLPEKARPVSWTDTRFIHVVAPVVIERAAKTGMAEILNEPLSPKAPSESTLQGYIYLKFSLDRAMASVQTQVQRSILATLAILLVGSGAGFVFYRNTVLRPIHRLIHGMTEVRRGRLDLNLESEGDESEIGTLTRTFNSMTVDLRKAEEALRQINSELEERVRERTRELEKANADLRESQDRVVRSEKLAAIGQLASGVGHELRNPLGAIANAVYYVRDSLQGTPLMESDPGLAEMLTLADREISSATRIISDLLDFSRVVKLASQPTDIHALLDELDSVLEVPPHVKIVKSFAENLPKVMVDPQKMRQVFVNLANNGIQAMTAPGEMRISTATEGGTLSISFQDTGVGIPPENLKKIFEPLFSTKAKGTGLGLPICFGIVKAHGGRIDLESTVGKGTTFTVRIPLADHSKQGETKV